MMTRRDYQRMAAVFAQHLGVAEIAYTPTPQGARDADRRLREYTRMVFDFGRMLLLDNPSFRFDWWLHAVYEDCDTAAFAALEETAATYRYLDTDAANAKIAEQVTRTLDEWP